MNTEQARDLLAEWARQGQEAAPPAWEELPGIPLYMDPVSYTHLPLCHGHGEPRGL